MRVADYVIDIGPGRRRPRRAGGGAVHGGWLTSRRSRQVAHRPVPVGGGWIPVPAKRGRRAPRLDYGCKAPASTTSTASTSVPAGRLRGGQAESRGRMRSTWSTARPLPVAVAEGVPSKLPPVSCLRGSTASTTRQGHRHRPVADRPHAAINPATYTSVFDDIRELRQDARRQGPRLPAGPLQLQRLGRPMRGVRGQRHPSSSRCTSCRTSTCRARCAREAVQPRDARSQVQAKNIPTCSRWKSAEAWSSSRTVRRSRHAADAPRRGPRLHAARPTVAHAVGRRGPAGQAGVGAGQARTGNTLYILDEPTTGLHFEDIHKLLTYCTASSTRATRSWSSSTTSTSSRRPTG